MSYDFHGKWESKTGHNAPLYAQANETDWRKQLSVDYGVKMWERLGAPKEKIVVGLATYGRSFTLASTANYGFNAPSTGGGRAGEFTKEAGFLAFYEICQMLKEGATYLWDDEQKVPYAIKDDLWVGFDDERSIEEKSVWINQNGYGGGMVWTVDMDDFSGTCSGIKYPLLHVMAHHLYGKPIPAGSQVSKIVARAAANPLPGITTSMSPTTNHTLNSGTGLIKSDASVDAAAANSTIEDKESTNARVVCYYTNWSRKRPGTGKFEPNDIDPTLCTHLIYAFAGLKENKIEPTEETDEDAYKQVVALKEKNPTLRVLLAIGGWMVGPQPFRTLTENVYRQTLFTFSAIEYLRAKGFDGLDLCWEFPRGTEDKARFTALVKVGNAKQFFFYLELGKTFERYRKILKIKINKFISN